MNRLVLISLIGKETILNYRIYKEFEPNMVIHLYSQKTQKEERILKSLIGNAVSFKEISVDANDYNQILEKLQSFLKVEKGDHIVVNLTGGTKMMALAIHTFVQQNFTENTSEFCYVGLDQTIHWFEKGSRDFFTTQLDFKEYIALKGQRIQSYSRYSDLIARLGESIDHIESLIARDYSNWSRFKKNFLMKVREERMRLQIKTSKPLLTVNPYKIIDESYNIDWNDDQLKIGRFSKPFIDLTMNDEDMEWFLFNAGWFELMVAKKYALKYNPNQIYMNVKFHFVADAKQEKNEIDIIINDGDKLIFIECKSGKVSPKDIDNIQIRKETYGGLISQSELITPYRLGNTKYQNNKTILEKCKDLGIIHKSIHEL